MKKTAYLLFLGSLALPAPASAEPTGVWWSGWGMGAFEYGIKKDASGADQVYIFCPGASGATVSFSVGGQSPRPNSTTTAKIGQKEFEFYANEDGTITTDSHVAASHFEAWWTAMRTGSSMTVTLDTGKSATFTLKGSAKELPRDPCMTGFAHY